MDTQIFRRIFSTIFIERKLKKKMIKRSSHKSSLNLMKKQQKNMSTTEFTFDENLMNETLMPMVKKIVEEHYSGYEQYPHPEHDWNEYIFCISLMKSVLKTHLSFSDGVNHEVNVIQIKIVEKEDGYYTQVNYRSNDTYEWSVSTNPSYSVRVHPSDDYRAFKWVVCDSMKAD